MPRKSVKKNNNTSFVNTKSYVSLLYGALSVLIVFIVILFGLKFFEIKKGGEITQQSASTQKPQELSMYTVKKGDTLWTIAETQYNNGDRWEEIARTNNMNTPNDIEVGQKLVLSDTKLNVSDTNTTTIDQEQKTPSSDPQVMTSTEPKITGNTYTVMSGDNLWNIAVRAYGNGYKWTEIARANNLANPSIIHRGNVFKLPR